MLTRYQVRIRRTHELHTFALRLNAARAVAPDPKAAQYRAALRLAIIGGHAQGPYARQSAPMIGAVERS
jgi:hypothetical protein